MIVGKVFSVDDQISAMLEAIAKIYSHHHWVPKRRPGKMINSFVEKPHASTMLGLFQYSLSDILFTALTILCIKLFIIALWVTNNICHL